jgi:hypothetical protein
MRVFRKFIILVSVFSLSIARAYAIQISLSGDSMDRYFQILEQYVLPLMVVSTIVLFCGYLASRVFHRTVSHREDGAVERGGRSGAAEDGTEAFLRELKATPPIDDAESRHEPRTKATHPLLRRRQAAREADLESLDDAPPARPLTAERSGRGDAAPADDSRMRAPVAPTFPMPPATDGSEARRVPLLKAAFRRPRQRAAEMAAPAEPAPVAPPPMRDTAENAPARLWAEPLRASEPASVEPRPDPARQEPARYEPTLSVPVDASDDAAERRREEPTISVVQAIKAGPVSPGTEVAKARAGEVVDSLDYIASVLQQASVLLAERLKNKQGLTLDDVRGLRVTGYDEPHNVLEDLRKLGGDAAEEVLNAFAAVGDFNNIVRRLEQMAEAEPLDEGWNDLIRSRISETIFTVGQVRKTLGIYRRAAKKPANAGMGPERGGAVSGTDGSVPVGRRQV